MKVYLEEAWKNLKSLNEAAGDDSDFDDKFLNDLNDGSYKDLETIKRKLIIPAVKNQRFENLNKEFNYKGDGFTCEYDGFNIKPQGKDAYILTLIYTTDRYFPLYVMRWCEENGEKQYMDSDSGMDCLVPKSAKAENLVDYRETNTNDFGEFTITCLLELNQGHSIEELLKDVYDWTKEAIHRCIDEISAETEEDED